jgi:hypothetical protein
MNRDLGVWTYEDCALVLIDYQREMFEVIRSETGADLAELNVRLPRQDRQGARHAGRRQGSSCGRGPVRSVVSVDGRS